jgi:hypothetical protein
MSTRNRFAVVPFGDRFAVVEIADNGAEEPVALFPTEAMARQWFADNAKRLGDLDDLKPGDGCDDK